MFKRFLAIILLLSLASPLAAQGIGQRHRLRPPATSDPQGVSGDCYVNTSTHKYRCYESGAWSDFGAAGSSANPFDDGTAIIKGSVDATKLLRFEVDGFTAGATRVLTPPNFDGTIATLAGSEALTNKSYNGNTLTAGSFTLTGGAGKTLVFNNNLTLSGTDGSTLNVGAGGTLGSNAFTSTAYEATANKDATGGYAGLTLFKINFKNAANTFTSFFTNANSAARTYTFQNRDGTIADDTDLALQAKLSGGNALSGNQTIAGTITQTSNSATAFESGPNGSTNPVLRLVNSTASQADGISITGGAAGGGTTFTALSSGSDSSIILTPKGAGFVKLSGFTAGIMATANSTFQVYANGVPIASSTSSAVNWLLRSDGCFKWSSGADVTSASDLSACRGAANTLNVGNGTNGNATGTVNAATYQVGGVTIYSSGTPSIAGNATLNTGSKDSAGKITSTGTGSSTAVITFSITFTRAPACFVTNETTSNLVRPISTTTTLTVNATVVNGDSLSYICTGY